MSAWHTRSPASRWLAWLLVAALHAALISQWRMQRPAHVEPDSTPIALRLIEATQQRPPQVRAKSIARSTPLRQTAATPVDSLLVPEHVSTLTPPGAPTQPASAPVVPSPIRVDAVAVSQAGHDAEKVGFRHMALVSGAYIGDPKPSKWQRFSTEVAAAAKGDCLAANSEGSLLSAATIAYAAAAGKCK